MWWCCVESASPKELHIPSAEISEGLQPDDREDSSPASSKQLSVNAIPVLADEDLHLTKLHNEIQRSGYSQGDGEVVAIPAKEGGGKSASDNAATQSTMDSPPPSQSLQKAWSSSTAGRRTRLALQAQDSRWKLRREDIQMGQELSRTLKSTLYAARWKGTEVVLKCVEVPEDYDRNARKPSKEEAFDPTSSRPVHASDMGQELMEELLHEIELLSSLRHPDLVLFIGACLDKDSPVFCITEYMPGGDLERHYMAMRRKHQTPAWRPPLPQILDWCTAVARGLTFLHSRVEPIIHRDLKPLNLLLTKHSEVKIADLGISKMMAAVAGDVYQMTGGVGSLLYMAPEVVRHQPYNEKVDIYAFALIMYFMSSGKLPFHEISKDPEVVLKQYLQGNEPRPNAAECHAPLRSMMQESWHVNYQQRPRAERLALQLAEAADNYVPPSCMCMKG